MKSKIILFLLFSNLLFSQQHCTVKYGVVATSGKIEDYTNITFQSDFMRKNMLELLKDADRTLQLLEYELVENNGKSVFKLLTKSTTEFKLNYAAVSFATNNIFYCTKDTIFKKNNLVGGETIITSSFNRKWTLLNESKIIDTNKCFKATCEMPWGGLPELNANKPNYIITAWYCPKIVSIFGPKGYGGLPGLILELQDRKITFLVKSINYDATEPIDFSKIDKIPHLTEAEYSKKLNDMSSMIGIK